MKEEVYVVAIGASAGGLEAIFQFFDNIPANPDLAYVVVRHLQRNYKSKQRELISQHTGLKVKSIEDGDQVEKNTIYLMPENKKISIQNRALKLSDRPADEVVNRAIDDFFFSLAEDVKQFAIGIILSGTGSDGTKGSYAIEQHGGIVIVQNPSEAQFDGMPKNAIYFDHPDYVLQLNEIPEVILKHVQSRSGENVSEGRI